MNVQAIVFTLLFVFGAIMVVISTNETSVTADNKMSNKVIKILRWLGSILAVIGIVGLIYTLGEIVYRGRKKIVTGEMGKLEKQIVEKHRVASNTSQNNGKNGLQHGGYIKTNSMYGRPKPTENDFKFIEQRHVQEVESQNTESTYLSVSEPSSAVGLRVSNRVYNSQMKTVMVKPANSIVQTQQNPHWGALNYEKKLAEIKNHNRKEIEDVKNKPTSEIEVAGPRVRKPKIEESPRMEVVYHISRDEFPTNVYKVQPASSNPGPSTMISAPPISIIHAKAEKKQRSSEPRTDSFVSSQDDASENSFIVAHNTLKVAWEQDLYQQKPNPRLNVQNPPDLYENDVSKDEKNLNKILEDN
uniref:Uncharacterized protein n=1 Tax=Panagrolaimus sp. JU765 TaxID=591449 RepID=A0AC34Q242_9BILA